MLELKKSMRAYAGNSIGIFPERDMGDGNIQFYVMTNDDGSTSSWANPMGQRPIVASSQAELDQKVAERFPSGSVKRVCSFNYLVGLSDAPYIFD